MDTAYTKPQRRVIAMTLIVLAILAGFAAWFAWFKFFRVVENPPWQAKNGYSADDMRFMYGSIGAENEAGIPYWIMYVLPRVFPDKLPGREGKPPGPGGFAAFGANWQQGEELPIGFTKKTIGFVRIANKCAACHTTSLRTKPDENPRFYPAGPNHTFNLQAFFNFIVECAKDPRFSSGRLMAEINLSADLSWIDQQIYRFILIPVTRRRLLDQEERLKWTFQRGHDWPLWGRGRDDAMNLTKYFLTGSKMDDTLGPTDMPSVWNLYKYNVQRNRMNFAGDSYDANSVIIDSALGLLGGAPASNQVFKSDVDWLHKYLGGYPAPKFSGVYPQGINQALVAQGKAVFDANCAMCHRSEVTGTVVPQTVVKTDINRILSWNREAAIKANRAVERFGIQRRGLVEANPTGYIAAFLDGIWLRAPYLHNGSVPTLRDLLKPAKDRTAFFYRGYNVYDPIDAGFVSTPAQAARQGIPWEDVLEVATPYDTRLRSCGNQGHEYGVALPDDQKEALLQYLKTL